MLLADFLREELGLTGTHLGCEHGICGACTVLLNGEPVRSCLLFAVQSDGCSVTTIEGLSKDGKLHPVQEAFLENRGLQCGFCTPGMILTAVGYLSSLPMPVTPDEARKLISGNICRCTGYQSIVQSIVQASHMLYGR